MRHAGPRLRWALALGVLAALPALAPPSAAASRGGLVCQEAQNAGWRRHGGLALAPAHTGARHALDPASLDALADLTAALAAQGTTLVMAVVPHRIVAAAAAGDTPPGLQWEAQRAAAAYDATLARLRVAGVAAPDLQALAREHVAGGGRFFLGLDTHWSQEGARLAAAAVTEAIEALPAAASLTRTPHLAELRSPPLRRTADLSIKLAQLCGGGAVDQVLQDHHFGPAVAPGLVEELPPPQVVLVGTSYSDHRFGFRGFMQQALSARVLDVHQGGGGPLTGLQHWLLHRDPTEPPPAVLVWELPARLLLGRGGGGGPEFDDQATWRQLVPLAWGDCGDRALDRGRVVPGVDWTPLLRGGDSGGHYVVVRTPGEPLESFSLRAVRKGEAAHEIVPLRENPRLGSQRVWYARLDSGSGQPLRRVDIRVPDSQEWTVRGTLCPAPRTE